MIVQDSEVKNAIQRKLMDDQADLLVKIKIAEIEAAAKVRQAELVLQAATTLATSIDRAVASLKL